MKRGVPTEHYLDFVYDRSKMRFIPRWKEVKY